ncbi:MAG: hypothetical protein NZ560_05625 [Aquificaceae bacterium]|nr:hypothetical protein [Aquificaceae bacterium]MDW8096936.1 hypothetical protein [Aquificaceae bacterium]
MGKNILYSILLETAVVGMFFHVNDLRHVLMILMIHAFACGLVASFLQTLLPKRYKKNRLKAFLLLTSLGFFLFVPGYIMLLVMTLYLLRRQKAETFLDVETLSVEELFMSNIVLKTNTFGEGPLYLLNRLSGVSEQKLSSISSLIVDAENPRILAYVSRVVSGEHDELRLSVFSTLLRLEKSIQDRINALIQRLEEEDSEDKRVLLLYDLSRSYYDLVYFGILDKELERLTLKKAEEYLMQAMEKRENAEFYIHMGKIELARGNYPQAERALLKAKEFNNVHPTRYMPYLAEAYFGMGYYDKVKEIFRESAEYLKYSVNPALYYLKVFWEPRHEGSD